MSIDAKYQQYLLKFAGDSPRAASLLRNLQSIVEIAGPGDTRVERYWLFRGVCKQSAAIQSVKVLVNDNETMNIRNNFGSNIHETELFVRVSDRSISREDVTSDMWRPFDGSLSYSV